ncbi:hypothetical protein SNE40_021392 [Patella caerulea]|uniref:Gamma-interferon-inducible lysosomal thiol reductase n=1 Tax=Patella caerulea TaxID=87958 RepID=A0AAN8GCM3_PATCE
MLSILCLGVLFASTGCNGDLAAPVKIDVYYETLCPDSKHFLLTQLKPTYHKLKDILEITLIPYGKATEKKEANGSYTFTCQHGINECYGNVIQACAIKHINDFDVYSQFIFCMEEVISTVGPEKAARNCSATKSLPIDDILTCATGNEGMRLQHDSAIQQGSLNPKINWVPWVVINNIHTDRIKEESAKNLLGLVCETYQGTQPAACNN